VGSFNRSAIVTVFGVRALAEPFTIDTAKAPGSNA